jgi:hypothetical protein
VQGVGLGERSGLGILRRCGELQEKSGEQEEGERTRTHVTLR